MLTSKQQDIIIQTMNPYDPIRIAYNAYDLEDDFIELLYEFHQEVDLIDITEIILELEN